MQLEHSFTVPVGVDEAWRILLDIERIGPCMPGAIIDSVDGDDFTGTVKVKLGPINLTYKGKASFVEKDEAAHRAVIDARGRDSRGNGTASAKVTATLHDAGAETRVKVDTDLDITGKPAQFGRGVMVDVGNKLIGQFADRLAETIGRGDGQSPAAAPSESASAAPPSAPAETAPAPAEAAAAQPAPKRPKPKPSPKAAAAEAAPSTEPTAPQPAAEPDASAATEPALGTLAAEPAAESTPAYGVPGGIPTPDPDEEPSMNGHSSTSPARPDRDVEPINLIESAGPAVAKRLAPVAVGLVIVLAAVRRRRGKRA